MESCLTVIGSLMLIIFIVGSSLAEDNLKLNRKAVFINKVAQVSRRITEPHAGSTNYKLPDRILSHMKNLYERGETVKLMKLIRAIAKLEQLYMMKKCEAMFSYDVCANSSAQPFFLWAKMFANKITKQSNVNNRIEQIIRQG